MTLKNILNKIPPNGRKYAVWGTLIGGLAILSIVGANMTGGKHNGNGLEKVNVKRLNLSPGNLEKDAWVAAQEKNIKGLEQQTQNMTRDITRIQQSLQEQLLKQRRSDPEVVRMSKTITELQATIENLKKEQARLTEETKTRSQQQQRIETTSGGTPAKSEPLPKALTRKQHNGKRILQPITPSVMPQAAPAAGRQGQTVAGAQQSADFVKVYGGDTTASQTKKPLEEKEEKVWLPAGAFMKAVMLNGIDAPTGTNARGEPYPVLLMVKDLTTLPNRFKTNLRECFVIAAGYGNISDERAYLRSETLSCVRSDGKIIENKITGHVIGEDGKLGVAGRLVSKQGQQIAMAILAGTLSGIGNALKPNQAYSIYELQNQGNAEQGNVQFKTPMMTPDVGQVAGAAAMGGVGNALEMVAQYYLRMAEKLYPVIEVDAGRQVELVLLQGQSLVIQGKS